MRETRETHSLRFSLKGWKVITERARMIYGDKDNRARYIEDLALNEAEKNAPRGKLVQ